MPIELTFTHEFSYDDDPLGINIPVLLSHGTTDVTVMAKVDSGSQICLFSLEIGHKLGLDVEKGVPIILSTLAGRLEAVGHEITIQIGELACHSLIYFAKYPGLERNILGRQGWLRNIRLALIDYDNLLYISPYDQ